MSLPKVLAVAVSALLMAGGGSALALGGHEPRRAASVASGTPGRYGVSGVVSGASREWRGAYTTGSESTVAPRAAGAPARSSRPARPSGSGSSGLAVPVGGAPLSTSEDPASAAGAGPSDPTAPGRPVSAALPSPTRADLPNVAAMTTTAAPDALVMMSSPLTLRELGALSELNGVNRIETVDTGTVSMGGAPVVAFGVEPNSFRNLTPPASASSDQLWRYLAGGALVSSYEMARDRSLVLGSTETVIPGASSPDASVKGWLGAFAAIGLPGVDLLIDHRYSAALGLTPDSGVVVSAPDLGGGALRSELRAALPGGAVELLHPDQLPATLAGDSLAIATRRKLISAALSRVGRPYVWGGAGPAVFDCSGLVQWSYRQAGILMPRVAAEQFLTGNHVPLSDAEPGDLLFWTYDPNDPGYVDHTAIYLGDGMMVVAPHTGTDVQIVPVPTQDFAGAVQVVLQN